MITSLERVRTACRHEAGDRVPAGPFTGFYAARMTGIPLGKYILDGTLIADAQIELQRQTGQDIVVTAADAYYLAEGFGLKVKYYDEALPTCEEPLFTDLKAVDSLRPLDPQRDGRMPVYLDAAQQLMKRVGERIAVRGTGTGPFSIAAYLYGMQNFLALLADIELEEAEPEDERRLHRLLEITTETSLAFLKAQAESGVHLIYLGDSLCSSEMISPSMYRRFAKPYHTRIFSELKDLCRRNGSFTLLHICGNNRPVLEDFADTGVDIIEIDQKLDLVWCKQTVGDRVMLIGNLDPAGTILHGTPDDVRRESLRCIDQAGAGGGFILGTGCFVPYDSPVENLQAMTDAAQEFGN